MALEANAEEFTALEALDNGKPIRDARAVDVPGSYKMFRYMSGWATRLNGETVPISAPGNWHAYTLREPVGVVGQIIPWNFPLIMAAWKLAPALAAGGCGPLIQGAPRYSADGRSESSLLGITQVKPATNRVP